MKIVWELQDIVTDLTDRLTRKSGTVKSINIESPSFTVLMQGKKTRWHFRIACFDLTSGYVGVYIILDTPGLELDVKCRFACLDVERVEVQRKEGFMHFVPDKACLGFRNFVHHSHLLIPKSNLVIKGSFYLTCTLYSTLGQDEYYSEEWIHTILGEETTIASSVVVIDSLWLVPPSVSYRMTAPAKESPSIEMLHLMYDLGLFADVEVTCGETTFHLHKCVLSAWSEVFLAMFSSPMKESQGSLEVTDCSEKVFGNLVRFMYTEQLPLDEEQIVELVKIADKYFIIRLKLLCEQVLTDKLNVGNISEMAWLAINHDCSAIFKDEIIAFIKDNREELNQSPELRQVLMSDSKMLWKLSVLYKVEDDVGPS